MAGIEAPGGPVDRDGQKSMAVLDGIWIIPGGYAPTMRSAEPA